MEWVDNINNEGKYCAFNTEILFPNISLVQRGFQSIEHFGK